MNIRIEISRTVKPYCGLITGKSEQYGFELEFIPMNQISKSYHYGEITKPGQYRVADGSSILSRRIDTGYIVVAEDGTVTEIEKSEVKL